MIITDAYLKQKYDDATLAFMRARLEEFFKNKPDYRQRDAAGMPMDGQFNQQRPQPFMLFTGGGNASGKTTLMNVMKQRGVIDKQAVAKGDLIEINNPLAMTGVQAALQYKIAGPNGEVLKDGVAEREKFYWIKGEDQGIDFAGMIVQEALRRGLSVTVDSHFRQPERYLPWVDEARSLGVPAILYGVTVSPHTFIERVTARNKVEGRPILYRFQLDRHRGFSRNWESIVPHFDAVALFDNEQPKASNATPGKLYREGVAADGSISNEGHHRLVVIGKRDASGNMRLKTLPGMHSAYARFLKKKSIPVEEIPDNLVMGSAPPVDESQVMGLLDRWKSQAAMPATPAARLTETAGTSRNRFIEFAQTYAR